MITVAWSSLFVMSFFFAEDDANCCDRGGWVYNPSWIILYGIVVMVGLVITPMVLNLWYGKR